MLKCPSNRNIALFLRHNNNRAKALNPISMKSKISFNLLFASMLLLGASTTLFAQKKLEYGIKAGGSLHTTLANNEASENYSLGFRVHAGAFVRYRVAERFALTAELMYMQKGGAYKFQGSSFMYLEGIDAANALNGADITVQGTRELTLNPTFNYIEMPLLASFEFVKNRWEIQAGPGIAILAGASLTGNSKFTPTNESFRDGNTGAALSNIEQELNWQNFADKAGVYGNNSQTGVNTRYLFTSTDNRFLYRTNPGMYYDYNEKPGSLFNMWDLTANVGVNYRASGSLRIGMRWQYSLLDITDNYFDRSRSIQDPSNPRIGALRAENMVRNMGFMLSLGFGF